MGAGADGTTQYIHDIFGNVIVEAYGSGVTQREYILIPGVGYVGAIGETPISDTVNRSANNGVSLPLPMI